MSLSYYLIVYVPEDSLECVKKAIFMQKAGRIGCYACCAWQTQGQGQFLPLDGAKPVMGQVNQIEKLNEWKLEVIVEKKYLNKVIKALKEAHPFETPVYHVLERVDENEF